MTDTEDHLTQYRQHMAAQMAYHKHRVDIGLVPRCGLRYLTSDRPSSTLVPDTPEGGHPAFACFSGDSRDPERYAIAVEAATELLEYVRAQP